MASRRVEPKPKSSTRRLKSGQRGPSPDSLPPKHLNDSTPAVQSRLPMDGEPPTAAQSYEILVVERRIVDLLGGSESVILILQTLAAAIVASRIGHEKRCKYKFT